jgi:hypothetical protein
LRASVADHDRLGANLRRYLDESLRRVAVFDPGLDAESGIAGGQFL